MSTPLTHSEVIRTSTRTGQLIRRLYGQPSIVIGIARSGILPARAFAEGSGADQSLSISLSRPSSSGSLGQLRGLWVNYIPKPIRQLYKQTLFQSVVRFNDASGVSKRNLTAEHENLLTKALKKRKSGPIIVVDDSIDSGGTISVIVKQLKAIDPDAMVIVFALASTLGRIVTKPQYSLISGKVADFIDGDLALIDKTDLLGSPFLCANPEPDAATNKLQLFLDLDGTLTSDSFKDAVNSLAWVYWQKHAYFDAASLTTQRLIKKLRLVNHNYLKTVLGRRILNLPPDWEQSYTTRLAHKLRQHARPALAGIATAPHVDAVIVTAALSAYQSAIEQAFDIPMITGSEINSEGHLWEIGSDQKIEAISKARQGKEKHPALLVGDTIVDSLSIDMTMDSVTVPSWDDTGLSTILGVSSWWNATGETDYARST